jgi:hypothetical protein
MEEPMKKKEALPSGGFMPSCRQAIVIRQK